MHKLLAAVLASAALNASAQVNPTADEEKNMKSLAAVADSGWSKGGTITLTSNLNYLSQWAAGGQSSLAGNVLLNYQINYRRKSHAWDNTFISAFGTLKQPLDQAAFKTDDILDITTKYGRKMDGGKWYYALLGNFKTQFAPGYSMVNGRPDTDKKISDFMAPAWALISLGADYKPNNKLTAFISPITYRAVIVMAPSLANAGAFGVKAATLDANGNILTEGENLRSEVGAYMRVNFNSPLNESLSWNTTMELFSNYRDTPQNIDVSWQSLFTYKLKKFLSATVFTHIIYDDNTSVVKETFNDGRPARVGPGVQLKSIVGLGITFKL